MFPSKRYIIPRDWFDNLMNNNFISNINNSQFLNTTFDALNQYFDERKIVIIIFELMEYINKNFTIDYIIQVDISSKTENDLIYINNTQIFNRNGFIEMIYLLNKDVEQINSTYLRYPHFQLLKESPNTDKLNETMSQISSIHDDQSTYTKYSYKEEMSISIFNLDIYKKEILFPIGLKNPSILCFMNSCLQILLSIPELNYFFLKKKFRRKDNQKKLICEDYSKFISLYQNCINNKENKMELPKNIIDICNSLVQKGVMNDSEEFLFLLLSSMQEELNQNVKDPKNENREKIIESKWVSYRVKNASFIDSIFTGFNQSKITCKNCTSSFYSKINTSVSFIYNI